MDDLSLPALENQDASRLPLGSLEKYAFSINRTSLLKESKDEDRNTADMKEDIDDNNENISTKASFVENSNEYIYYSMLNIDTQIQNLGENNTNNKNKLKQLQRQFDLLVEKLENSFVLLFFSLINVLLNIIIIRK